MAASTFYLAVNTQGTGTLGWSMILAKLGGIPGAGPTGGFPPTTGQIWPRSAGPLR